MLPIQIKPGKGARLIVILPYSPDRLAKIKTVAGRVWHGPEKHWTVPNDEGMIARLTALFDGDHIELPIPRPSLCPEHAILS